MDRKQRVLLVDDDENFTFAYSNGLQGGGFDVDVVHTADDAIRCLDNKVYEAAVIDMNLSGPPKDNSGGLSVLRHASALEEPPALVVCTGDDRPQFAADLFQEWRGVSRFVAKSELTNKGSAELLHNIRTGIAGRPPSRDHRKDMMRVLAGAEREDAWVHSALSTLTPSGGYQGLVIFLQEFFRGLLPLLPSKDKKGSQLHVADGGKALVGAFWSKGIGAPVVVNLSSIKAKDRSGVAERPSNAIGETPAREHEQSGVYGAAWKVAGSSREGYGS
jgi:CheY-like chemotaxis protein